MVRRIRQFISAIYPRRLDPDELAWINRHLAPAERAIFFQMALYDQKHAVAVSRRAERLARERGVWDGRRIRIVVRAGLLHDIGKIRGDLGVWDRVAIVLSGNRPEAAKRWIEEGVADLLAGRLKSGIRRARYAEAVHPARGAAMARLMGVEEEVVSLIRRHQHDVGEQGGDAESDLLLELLIDADRSA